ncbi:hypothetical protein [Paraburkholderia sp. BL10I2N1]|uniref:hypothetical protein n=1 Tax=Paraburkholderia sp. BL10I2N1 TaxID=1938796 RepID=UPI001061CB27|nr:hypothetical protein [Paraburkholderia sp. BL10I2N1]TDN69504.1 hypothetical protein B0G77_2898 [Paraburkholderia sp. BL10I2N1]
MLHPIDNRSTRKALASITLLLLCLIFFGNVAHANCKEFNNYSIKNGVYIPGDDSERQVIGKGRLQFYSAPDKKCKIAGVFILPGERVDAYTEYNNFTSVVYINVNTDANVTGWVQSDRLKPTGLGIAPHQQ